ncbi:MAG TPA: FAD/NAD(P)-binding protein [bacterium]|nr:FAD/NAD(P)-binding protein [bacterium]
MAKTVEIKHGAADGRSLFMPMKARIVRTAQFTALEKFFEIELDGGKDLGHKPGQFVEVSIFGVGEAPISISSSPTKKGSFDICARNVGSFTGVLHGLNAGATLGIRGPFGNGFDIDKFLGKDVLFVGGGLGIIPLRSLINYVIDNRKKFGRVVILYGTKSSKDILFKDEIAQWEKDAGIEFLMTIDKYEDGWAGNVGVITTLFKKFEVDPHKTAAAVVGPPIMYKYVLAELLMKKLSEDSIFFSLERRMKCGVGKCGHCQINQVYCCLDGPVFSYKQLRFLPEWM